MSYNFACCLQAVDRHRGNSEDFACRLRIAADVALREGRKGIREFARRMVRWIAFDANLNLAFEHLRRYGGDSPGPDDQTTKDLAASTGRYDYLRGLGKDIRNQSYLSGSTRTVSIPKGSGNGHRVIEVQDLEDRIVHRAIAQVLQPILDPQFDDGSCGFRPGRDRLDALVRAERSTIVEKRKVWVTEDVKDAFPSIPLQPLLEVAHHYLPATNLRKLLVSAILPEKKRGLVQGSPLSPILLNLYLHHHLDRPWRKKFPTIPLVRYADDILLLCRSVGEAKEARASLVNMLVPHGMQLKSTPEAAVRNLARGKQATWLGYEFRLQHGDLVVALAPQTIENLMAKVHRNVWEPEPGVLADQVIQGWLTQAGPAYSPAYAKSVCDVIVTALEERGLGDVRVLQGGRRYRHLASRRWMLRLWETSHKVWLSKRKAYAARCSFASTSNETEKSL